MSNKKTMRKMRKMRTIRKTKMINKNHKYTRYKNRSVGGDSLSNDNNANEIMNEVKNERKSNINLGNIPMFKKTGDLAEGLTIKGIENLGLLLGVDLSNSQSINAKLTQIKIALADPKNKEKVKEIVSEAAKVGAVAIEAASPFIKPLVDKTVELGSDALTKMGEAAVKIGLNTAEEIPGVGVVIGTVRSLSNASEALLAASNSASEIVTASSDTINAAIKNFERLMEEKINSMNRINESVSRFQQPFTGQKIMQLPSPPMQLQKLTGGNTGKYKRNK